MGTATLILTLPLDEGEELAQKPGSFNTPRRGYHWQVEL